MAAIDFPSSPTNGQVFTSGDKTWVYSTSVTAWNLQTQLATLDNLSDVVITSPATGSTFYFDGTNWIDSTTLIPNVSDTLVGRNTTDTLTNKTLTTPIINGPTITATGQTPVIHGILLPNTHGIYFEGATTDAHQTYLYCVDPTADRTILLPNADGTIALSGSIALGTDTTGNYVGTITAGTGIATSGASTGEGIAHSISLAANYGDTLNPYASKTANYVLAAPNGTAGVPTFRAIVAADIPTLNQNTTGTAATVTGAAQTAITSLGTLTGLRVDGNFGIGASGLTQIGLRLAKNIGGSAFSQGIYINGTIQTDATSRADSIWASPTVAASATLPTVNQFYATIAGVGSGSTVTTSAGFVAESNIGSNDLGTITNAYGFVGNLVSGTNRYNLFMNGSAPNFLNGRLGVGVASNSYAMVQIINTTAGEKALVVRGAASQSGDLLDVQNSAATSQFKVGGNGNTLIGSGSTASDKNLTINRPITGGTIGYGTYAAQTVQPDVTDWAIAYTSNINTAAAAFTLSQLYHYHIFGVATPGAGSTITTQTGFYVNPSLTGATNNYGFRGDIPSGTNRYNLYMSGTAQNYMAGNTAIGATAADTGATLRITNSSDIVGIRIRAAAAQAGQGLIQVQDSSGNLLSGISPNGNFHIGTVASTGSLFRVNKILTGQIHPNFIFCNSVIDSDYPSIAAGYGYWSQIGATSATSATIPIIYHNLIQQGTFTNTTVTSQHGYHVDSSLTGATNNYGYFGNIAAATGRWNLYMGGTAHNYMLGRLGVGATLTSGAMAQITNTTAADKAFVVKGAASQSGDFFDIQNSAGTSQFKVDSIGNIGVSNTPAAGRSFVLSKTMTGSIAPIGFFSSGQIQSDATNSANYFNTFVGTAATAFTCGTVIHYKTQQGTIGAGSSIGTQVGFLAESSLTGATGNNLGFWGAIPADAAKNFNLYISGTAPNYLLGRLGIGATLTSGAMAQITNTTAGDKAFVVKGASSQTGDLFDVQNSSGFSLFKINSAGAGWFRQEANGLQINLNLGRMDDGLTTPLYQVQTDDTNGDILRFYSTRWSSTVKFARSSSGGDKDMVWITGGDGGHAIEVFDTSNSVNTRINSNGATYFNGGNVGIGTSSPATKLDVVGTITATSYTGELASAVTATTQTVGDNSTKVATTAFVIANAGSDQNIIANQVFG